MALLAALLPPLTSLAQTKPAPPKAPAPAEPAPAAAPAANAITQAAVAKGMLACAGRVNQVTDFATGGKPAGVFLFVPPAQPDQRLFSVSIEAGVIDPPAYVSASFAPNQANGCGAVYEAVAYWPQGCDKVAAKQFAELKRGPVLQKTIQVLEGAGPHSRVFLMPAGGGCVSIKKEIVL
jgi:hypothetical protein